MSVKNSPCKDCPSRYPGCHSNCKDYKEFKQALDERNDLIRQERDRYNDVRAGSIESRRRTIRRKRPNYKHKY